MIFNAWNMENIRLLSHMLLKMLNKVWEIQITENDGGNGAFREVADCLVG